MIDTEALRRRMGGAIVGTRADGTQAVLIPLINARYLDLIRGDRYSPKRLTSHFVSLIRPGDECEVRLRPSLEWKRAKYFGFNAGYFSYFMASIKDGVAAWEFIRPLPKEHLANRCTCVQYTNGRPSHVLDPSCSIHGNNHPIPEPVTKAAEIGPKYAGGDSKEFWKRVNALPESDHMSAYSMGVALQNMEGTVLHFINQCERNAKSSEPVGEPSTCSECGDKLVKCVDLASEIVSYYCPSCQRKANLLTRLAATERELAAIRAEMKGTQ